MLLSHARSASSPRSASGEAVGRSRGRRGALPPRSPSLADARVSSFCRVPSGSNYCVRARSQMPLVAFWLIAHPSSVSPSRAWQPDAFVRARCASVCCSPVSPPSASSQQTLWRRAPPGTITTPSSTSASSSFPLSLAFGHITTTTP